MTADANLPTFGEADYLDDDTYGVDARDNMNLREDTIVSASLVSVTRADDVAMGADDHVVTSVGIVATGVTVPLADGPHVAEEGMFYSWRGTGGMPGVSYRVKVQLTLASGNTIDRTTLLKTPMFVG